MLKKIEDNLFLKDNGKYLVRYYNKGKKTERTFDTLKLAQTFIDVEKIGDKWEKTVEDQPKVKAKTTKPIKPSKQKAIELAEEEAYSSHARVKKSTSRKYSGVLNSIKRVDFKTGLIAFLIILIIGIVSASIYYAKKVDSAKQSQNQSVVNDEVTDYVNQMKPVQQDVNGGTQQNVATQEMQANEPPSRQVEPSPEVPGDLFIKMGNLNAPRERQFFVFSDPECHHCQEFEKIYTQLKPQYMITLVPVSLHDNSDKYLSAISCAAPEKKAGIWASIMSKNFNAENAVACEKGKTAPLRSLSFFKAFRFQYTPTIVASDSRVHDGAFANLKELVDWLANKNQPVQQVNPVSTQP